MQKNHRHCNREWYEYCRKEATTIIVKRAHKYTILQQKESTNIVADCARFISENLVPRASKEKNTTTTLKKETPAERNKSFAQ